MVDWNINFDQRKIVLRHSVCNFLQGNICDFVMIECHNCQCRHWQMHLCTYRYVHACTQTPCSKILLSFISLHTCRIAVFMYVLDNFRKKRVVSVFWSFFFFNIIYLLKRLRKTSRRSPEIIAMIGEHTGYGMQPVTQKTAKLFPK